MNKEALQSIYAYNMLFNSSSDSDNVGENVKFNTDLISDFDLQNFDAKRFEYYTTLLKTFDNDMDTLKNVLNKYNSVKSLRVKERKLIREINDYVNKINSVKTGGGNKPMTAKQKDRIRRAKKKIKKKYGNEEDEEDDEEDEDEDDEINETELKKKISDLISKVNNPGSNTDKKKAILIHYLNDLKKLDFQKGLKLKEIEEYEKIIEDFDKEIKRFSGGGFISDNNRDNFLKKLNESNKKNEGLGSNILEEAKNIINIAKKFVEKKRLELNSNEDSNEDSKEYKYKYLKRKLLGKITGGASAEEKYSDDTLKSQYLDRQRYDNISPVIKDELRSVNDNKKGNLVRIKTDNKIDQLSNDIETYNALSIQGREANKEDIIKKIKDFENDPLNPLEELEITLDDRIVFIIATFFIRYITIIMVQWCIDINIIKSFYEGFIYYAIIYIILFWFVVLFINIDNGYDIKYMNLNGIINSIRSLFYYFYMGTNGISRLLIHTSLILLLIVIPIILNIKKKPEFKDEANDEDDTVESAKILNYEERKQLSKTLTLFTMFIWLFTSIIATKF
jgi:hypothetical protein